jgi:hypothetical protein
MFRFILFFLLLSVQGRERQATCNNWVEWIPIDKHMCGKLDTGITYPSIARPVYPGPVYANIGIHEPRIWLENRK